MERKNPDFVNVERANKTLTGFKQDSTRRMFIGEQRRRYTIFVYTDYPLYLKGRTNVQSLYDKAEDILHRDREIVIYDINKNLKPNVEVTTKEELQRNYAVHREQRDNNEIRHVESNVLGFNIQDRDLCNVANVISEDGKIYFVFERKEERKANIYMIGDKGWALFVNRYIGRGKDNSPK